MYYIQLLDNEKTELASYHDVNLLKDAKSIAKGYLKDLEYPDAHKVEIRNSDNHMCVWDKFK